jgi:hypothetical protein
MWQAVEPGELGFKFGWGAVDGEVARWEAWLLVVCVRCAYDSYGRRAWGRGCDGGLVCVEPCCEEESGRCDEALKGCGWSGTEEVRF